MCFQLTYLSLGAHWRIFMCHIFNSLSLIIFFYNNLYYCRFMYILNLFYFIKWLITLLNNMFFTVIMKNFHSFTFHSAAGEIFFKYQIFQQNMLKCKFSQRRRRNFFYTHFLTFLHTYPYFWPKKPCMLFFQPCMLFFQPCKQSIHFWGGYSGLVVLYCLL